MAVNKKRAPIINDFCENHQVKTFSESLRSVSNDKTLIKAKYVGMNTDIVDMIADGQRNSTIKDIFYDEKNERLIIVKTDGQKVVIPLKDNYLAKAVFNINNDEAKYTLKDGSLVTMDLSGLEDKAKAKWGEF